MTDDMKEAVKLIIECCDELRLHDEEYQHVTSEGLKNKVLAFMAKHGMTDEQTTANVLGLPINWEPTK